MATQTESIQINDAVVINEDENGIDTKDEEKEIINNISMDDSLQKKSNLPSLAPVTFHFVGIRPTKLHEKNKQTSIKLLNTCSTKINFKNLTLNDTLKKLKKLIVKEFKLPNNNNERSLLIMYGNMILKDDKDDKLLSDIGITDNSTFLIAVYDNINTNHKDIYIERDEEEEISRAERERNRRERDMDSVKRRLKRIQDLKNGIKVEPSNKCIKKKKIINNNIIHIDQLKQKLQNLKIEIVKGFDIITQENDINCMKLPICGHILSKDSLNGYCLSQFMDREQILKCPHTKQNDNNNNNDNSLCGQKWEYPVIKQYLLLKQDGENKEENDKNEQEEEEEEEEEYLKFGKLELLSARNVIEMNYELQKCIKCKTLLYRNQRDNNFAVRTECPLCPNTIFCWGCNEKWSEDHHCDTSFRAQTMEIISNCPLKKVGRVKQVPSIRSCPKCHQLIHHVSACKHMKCSFCKTNFCFICLKEQKNSKWQCGDYSDSCPVHKRQNHKLLPKLNQTSFQLF